MSPPDSGSREVGAERGAGAASAIATIVVPFDCSIRVWRLSEAIKQSRNIALLPFASGS